jgi:D-alanyl-D-alanine endopeptidase (penicillin-binding protein 7)
VQSVQRGATLDDAHHLALQSSAVLVQDQATGAILLEKNSNAVLPIASITKLMTAMVALDAARPERDPDDRRGGCRYASRAPARGSRSVPNWSREEMLRLALMSSENRAASALSRHYPGGREAFIVPR